MWRGKAALCFFPYLISRVWLLLEMEEHTCRTHNWPSRDVTLSSQPMSPLFGPGSRLRLPNGSAQGTTPTFPRADEGTARLRLREGQHLQLQTGLDQIGRAMNSPISLKPFWPSPGQLGRMHWNPSSEGMPIILPLTRPVLCGVRGRAGAGQKARTGTARSPSAPVSKSLTHNLGPDLVSTSSGSCKLLPVTFPRRREGGGGMGGMLAEPDPPASGQRVLLPCISRSLRIAEAVPL